MTQSTRETPSTTLLEAPGSEALTPPEQLQGFFERSARRDPEAIAIDAPNGGPGGTRERLSYGALDAAAEALAAALEGLLGAAPEPFVAILAPRVSSAPYRAQLAALKAGAATLCLDPSFPCERVCFMLEDARPRALLHGGPLSAAVRAKASELGCALIDLEAPLPATPVSLQPPRVATGRPRRGHALAYVIYTSGTTGRPKGVLVEHRGVINLVADDLCHFGLGPGDRVAQTSSLAYDSSVEEIYLAFAAGATLVVADDEVARLGPDLISWLQRERVSVLCPPPTLLRATGCADPEAALPELRLLYVGGEALPADLAALWARGRRMVNGYGPTECSVTVTRAEVVPGAPVRIGHAVTNNRAHVLDAALEPVAPGEEGELCLAGVGLARGYLDRPELTAERFVEHPRLGRLYRSGDLVCAEPSGALDYRGRIDSQVKLRGYRVELEAIEAALCREDAVEAAACALRGEGPSAALVAFVVPRADAAFEPEALRAALGRSLPPYMIPARLAALAALPTNTSGKLDRRALPALDAAPTKAAPLSPDAAPKGPLEELIAAAFAAQLGLAGAPPRDRSFFELGGDSLRAALLISELRRRAETRELTVRDVYDAPSLSALAARAAKARAEAAEEQGPRPAPRPTPSAAGRALFTLAQGAVMTLELVTATALGYAVLVWLLPWLALRYGIAELVFALPFASLALWFLALPLSLGAALLAKRLLIGRYQPARHAAFGAFHFRHWWTHRFVGLIPWGLIAGTELQNMALRALGARIGRGVRLHRGAELLAGGWDLMEIGDEVCVGRDAALRALELESQQLVVGPIRIGAGATLETRAGLGPHTTLGEGAVLSALSSLEAGQAGAAHRRLHGVPAEPTGPVAPPPVPDRAERAHGPLPYAALALAGRALAALSTAAPVWLGIIAAIVLTGLDAERALDWLFAPTPPSGALCLGALALVSLILCAQLLYAALFMRLMGRVEAGVYPLSGLTSVRLWIKESTLESAGRWLSGSLLWPPWLRLAGMKIGRGCEVSSIMEVVPEQVTLGDGCFFADGIYLGNPELRAGALRVAPVRFGADTFLGNHAVIPAGSTLPETLLLGVCTLAEPARARPNSGWFGHPAFLLPRREVVECDRSLTHDPAWYRVVRRLLWEAARLALPALPLLLTLCWLRAVAFTEAQLGLAAFFLSGLPAVSAAAASVPVALVWLLKWTLLGRVRPGQHALWSGWCSRWDFLYVAWGAWARPTLATLEGTLLLHPWLRAMGLKIGRGVLLGGGFAQVVDPDMLRFEDHATVANLFQAHSFEDRVLKVDHVDIREGASVGPATVMLYGAEVGAEASVGSHSVIMKREALPAARHYQGAPTRPRPRPAIPRPNAPPQGLADRLG